MKEYDTLSAFYLDLRSWETMKKFYDAFGTEPPPKPVWNPSKDYKEYD